MLTPVKQSIPMSHWMNQTAGLLKYPSLRSPLLLQLQGMFRHPVRWRFILRTNRKSFIMMHMKTAALAELWSMKRMAYTKISCIIDLTLWSMLTRWRVSPLPEWQFPLISRSYSFIKTYPAPPERFRQCRVFFARKKILYPNQKLAGYGMKGNE